MRHRIVELLSIVVLSAGAGWLYAMAFGTRPGAATLHGLAIGLPILLFERGFVLTRLRTKLRSASTPVFLVVSIVAILGASALGNVVAVLALRALTLGSDSIAPDRSTLSYSLVIAILMIAAFRVRDLVGPRNLVSLTLGRYHKPVREVRVFMFVDLVGSTQYARRNGDRKALALLSRVFASLSDPVRRFGGEIDDYVGDMAIVTWQLGHGVRHAGVVRCILAFLDEIDRDADRWTQDFGVVPRFRAALHCGSVLTAEVGFERHKISYFGDVMNTTSRLEGLAKELDFEIVISTDLLQILPPLPSEVSVVDLGLRNLRGHDEPLAVSAICRPGVAASARPRHCAVDEAIM